VIWFRTCDARWPFFWDAGHQRPGRWHGAGEGPVQYLADTPDGAWAEFLRHEEITDPDDLAGIERAVWAVDVAMDEEETRRAALDAAALRGGLASYAACQAEARRLRARGATALQATSAALLPGGARGQVVREGALVEGRRRDGRVLALFGSRPGVKGWRCALRGRPHERLLALVRRLYP
jgi:RES domain